MITRDEWLKALVEAGVGGRPDDREALTTAEFGAMMGLNELNARRQLEKLVAAGKATRTSKWSNGKDGRRLSMNAYRLVP